MNTFLNAPRTSAKETKKNVVSIPNDIRSNWVPEIKRIPVTENSVRSMINSKLPEDYVPWRAPERRLKRPINPAPPRRPTFRP